MLLEPNLPTNSSLTLLRWPIFAGHNACQLVYCAVSTFPALLDIPIDSGGMPALPALCHEFGFVFNATSLSQKLICFRLLFCYYYFAGSWQKIKELYIIFIPDTLTRGILFFVFCGGGGFFVVVSQIGICFSDSQYHQSPQSSLGYYCNLKPVK